MADNNGKFIKPDLKHGTTKDSIIANPNSLLKEEDGSLSQEVEQRLKEEEARFNLVNFITSRKTESENARDPKERIWIKNFLSYRGLYNSEQRARIEKQRQRDPYASDFYIKITKTKTIAAYNQLQEILLANNKFPIQVKETPVPEGTEEYVHMMDGNIEAALATTGESVPDNEYAAIGYEGDGREVPPGADSQTLLRGLYNKLKQFTREEGGTRVAKPGPSPDKNQFPQFSPAKEAARKLDTLMQDQLVEGNALKSLRNALLEQCILGTGILKGPFNYHETVHRYEQDPDTKKITYKPYIKRTPRFQFVSCWNFYPDPEATSIEDADYVIERHLMSKHKVRDLRNQPFFDEDAIREVIESNPTYHREEWEDLIQDSNEQVNQDGRYEIFEYWGWIDKELLDTLGIFYEDEDIVLGQVQINAWCTHNRLLRVVVNPFIPARIPYHAAPYEELPYEIWGVGIPENMEDTQSLMNAHMRMAIDNLRLAGNVIFEVNENMLVPGQDMTVYPGKIFRKQGGAPGQALFSHSFNDTSGSHMVMFKEARQLADEATSLPSFMHGQTGVTGIGRSTGGISMLMSAAASSIKGVIRNIDNDLLKPLGDALFQWNMQFNEEDVEIRGDVKIVAKGTSSLMQKEVLTQRYMTLLQIGSNPAVAPFVNIPNVLKKIAIAMELDENEVVNDVDQAKLFAEVLQNMQAMQQPQQPGMQEDGTQQGTMQEAPAPNRPQGQGGPQAAPPGVSAENPAGANSGSIGVGAMGN